MKYLSVSFEGPLCKIQMNQPEKKNPLSRGVLTEINEALATGLEKGCIVTVLQGAGDSFSSGYTLETDGRSDYIASHGIMDDIGRLRHLADLLLAIRKHPLPLLTQVHGYCAGGGTDLLLVSDIAIAADTAKIGVPNVRSLGISLMSTVWSASIGAMRAKMLMFTGDWISGKDAVEWGLAGASVPADRLDAAVQALAGRIAKTPVDLLKVTKLTANRMLDSSVEQLVAAAIELDTIAHFSAPVENFWKIARQDGLKQALSTRNAAFAGDDLFAILKRG